MLVYRQEIAAVQSEIAVLKKFLSPFIVKFYENFIDGDYAYIIMEYASHGRRPRPGNPR